ncbi:snRNA-activating protein complex subunit 1 [Hydra vulgaris]|uniref:snRNA-activating protein complex subunit 1 n=1 Tax=Hydra vulgaris TaxID=6087 RepID=T2MCT5_HYDVU|nr:snRNA-activating protein complex subunit 1 [Hydra vulgaris]
MAFSLSTEFEAIRHDISTLFSKFCEKQSVRFEDFSQTWRSINFTYVMVSATRGTNGARMRICERIFRAASEYLSTNSVFLYRVAAVYLLYAVYFKQFSDKKVFIRVTPKMLKDMIDFFKISIEHEHYDVAFVIKKLFDAKAFIIVAFPKQLMFGRLEFMMGVQSENTPKVSFEIDPYIKSISDGKFIELISSIHNEYEEVKAKLLSASKKQDEINALSKRLSYCNSDFPKDFKNLLTNRESLESLTVCKSDTLETVQRPSLTPLNELILLQADSSKVVGEQLPERASILAKIKERSWKNDARNKKLNSQLCDTEEETETSDLFYKKSAMVKVYKRNIPRKHGSGLKYRKPLKK